MRTHLGSMTPRADLDRVEKAFSEQSVELERLRATMEQQASQKTEICQGEELRMLNQELEQLRRERKDLEEQRGVLQEEIARMPSCVELQRELTTQTTEMEGLRA